MAVKCGGCEVLDCAHATPLDACKTIIDEIAQSGPVHDLNPKGARYRRTPRNRRAQQRAHGQRVSRGASFEISSVLVELNRPVKRLRR